MSKTTSDTDKAFQTIVDIQCEKADKSEREVNILRECNEVIDKGELTKVGKLLQILLNGKGEK